MTEQPNPTKPTDEIADLKVSDINVLLDFTEEAAFLIQMPERKITAVNAIAVELTAYTRNELTGMSLLQVLSFESDPESILATRRLTRQLPTAHLTNRHQQRVPVYARILPISERWRLVTVQPVQIAHQQRKDALNFEQIIDSFFRLAKTLATVTNPSTAIPKVLEIGIQLIEPAILTLYLGESQEPGVRKISEIGKQGVFPDLLSPVELNQLLEPSLWKRGHRTASTALHRSARVSNFSYLATTPIGDNPPMIGCLVAGGYQEPVPEYTLQLLKILGDILGHIIHQSILFANLRSDIERKLEQVSVLNAIKHATQDGILAINPDLKITDINTSAEEMLGYSKDEALGENVENILIGAERLGHALDLVFQGIATPDLGENTRIHRRDGSVFLTTIEIIPAYLNRKVIGAIVRICDESEREQMRIQTRQLEQRALLGDITAVFAHEVRNPINNISLGLQVLADSLDANDHNQDTIERMRQDCQRLTDLMKSVLDFSKSSNYNFSPVDLPVLIERLIKRWGPRLNRLNIKHHVQVSQGILKVSGDRRALEQVFTNLISNATQAMESMGTGMLAIRITPTVSEDGRPMVQIDISDSGPGIPGDILNRIFDPFFTTKQSGTGLGLSITKQIVTAHKGSLSLTTFPGGTIFHVRLPAIPQLTMETAI